MESIWASTSRIRSFTTLGVSHSRLAFSMLFMTHNGRKLIRTPRLWGGDGGLARPCIKISVVVRANEIIEDSIQITKHNFMLG